MDIYQFPKKKKSFAKGWERKNHEFAEEELFIDGNEDDMIYGSLKKTQLKSLMGDSYPFTWRLVTLFGSLGCLCLAFLCLIYSVILLMFVAISLGRLPYLNLRMRKSFANIKHSSVLTIGLFIATFNPALGVGMLVVHSTMTGSNNLQKIFIPK